MRILCREWGTYIPLNNWSTPKICYQYKAELARGVGIIGGKRDVYVHRCVDTDDNARTI